MTSTRAQIDWVAGMKERERRARYEINEPVLPSDTPRYEDDYAVGHVSRQSHNDYERRMQAYLNEHTSRAKEKETGNDEPLVGTLAPLVVGRRRPCWWGVLGHQEGDQGKTRGKRDGNRARQLVRGIFALSRSEVEDEKDAVRSQGALDG